MVAILLPAVKGFCNVMKNSDYFRTSQPSNPKQYGLKAELSGSRSVPSRAKTASNLVADIGSAG